MPSDNPSSTHRREFLRSGLSLGSAVGLAAPFQALLARVARGQARSGVGYGPLQPVNDETTGLPLLKLPVGFRYVTFGWNGDPLSDGRKTPGAHDGMAVTAVNGDQVTLIRNHEINSDLPAFGPAEITYDPHAGGGTVNLVFDTQKGRLVSSRVSICGTVKNCAGGPTPWGSWLTCEETTYGPGDSEKADVNNLKPADAQKAQDGKASSKVKFEKTHGWIFDVPANGAAKPVPIEGMGRFVHEAVAVDPATGTVYETEDAGEAGFYRYVPRKPGALASGGKLEMLVVPAKESLGKGVKVGQSFSVRWTRISDPTRAHSPGNHDSAGVFKQGKEQGGTSFKRLEGCWYHAGAIYFVSTNGGEAGAGQIWRYSPGTDELTLIFVSPSKEVLDMPDNITVSPRGGIVLCEDGSLPGQRLHGMTLGGELFTLAVNNVQLNGEKNGLNGDFRDDEWAGATFTPDGSWLFANLQNPGITVAITGPWDKGPL